MTTSSSLRTRHAIAPHRVLPAFCSDFFAAGARRWQKIRTCLRGTIRRWRCLSSHLGGLTLIPTRRPIGRILPYSCIEVGRRKSDLRRSEEWGMDRSVAQATAISRAIREDVAEVAVAVG